MSYSYLICAILMFRFYDQKHSDTDIIYRYLTRKRLTEIKISFGQDRQPSLHIQIGSRFKVLGSLLGSRFFIIRHIHNHTSIISSEMQVELKKNTAFTWGKGGEKNNPQTMLLGEYSVRTGKTPQQHKSTYTTADRSEQRRMVGGGGGGNVCNVCRVGEERESV